ncbi:hypothetical protein GA0115245_110818 [Streptomyces sp. di188]|nr:hypothetical protein GA0115245_110818 [Streptomyces sp. di188]
MSQPRITVLGVQPGPPPFRIVEIDGQVVGEARDVTDVLQAAAVYGIRVHDLDDPDTVRWVGGDKFTWSSRQAPRVVRNIRSSPRRGTPPSAGDGGVPRAHSFLRRTCTARLIRRPTSR